MTDTFVAGTGIAVFDRSPSTRSADQVEHAVRAALEDAAIGLDQIDAVYVGNAASGLLTGQEMIRGQVLLRQFDLSGVPIVNCENACASGSTALHLADTALRAGRAGTVLVVGAEKMASEDKQRPMVALAAAVDQERLEEESPEVRGSGSLFMDIYAQLARDYMSDHEARPEDFAALVVKNRRHASHNPVAQFTAPITVEEVLEARLINDPLTLPMCSPIGNGAAALVLTIEPTREATAVRLLASSLVSGQGRHSEPAVAHAARLAFDQSGVSPGDVNLAEVHDATAPAELIALEELGLLAPGEGVFAVRKGRLSVGGDLPTNPSGGLVCKGHPVGATGVAQVVEVADQLRGRAGGRQVEGARIGITENAGGWLGGDVAAATVHILGR